MGHLGDTEAYMRSLCKATWRLGVLAGWGWVTQCALSFCPVRMRWEGGYLQPKKRAFAEELNWLAPWILDFPASQNSEKCLLWWWFSCSVMSNSLQPHELQHARSPCPSPFPGACSNSCPLSRWCHLTISSSVVPFSSCLQSFPASGSFPMSQLFASGGQSIGASASASILRVNTQSWFPSGLTGWISLQSKGLSRAFSCTTVWNYQFFGAQPSLWSNSHIHTWPLKKPKLWL